LRESPLIKRDAEEETEICFLQVGCLAWWPPDSYCLLLNSDWSRR